MNHRRWHMGLNAEQAGGLIAWVIWEGNGKIDRHFLTCWISIRNRLHGPEYRMSGSEVRCLWKPAGFLASGKKRVGMWITSLNRHCAGMLVPSTLNHLRFRLNGKASLTNSRSA